MNIKQRASRLMGAGLGAVMIGTIALIAASPAAHASGFDPTMQVSAYQTDTCSSTVAVSGSGATSGGEVDIWMEWNGQFHYEATIGATIAHLVYTDGYFHWVPGGYFSTTITLPFNEGGQMQALAWDDSTGNYNLANFNQYCIV
jgi:hypothetical protein